ncbi:10310_t:CDS:2 [Funneliformis geosporum]|nr:10310_t:CDS:2 [Funneliformis geosporum]
MESNLRDYQRVDVEFLKRKKAIAIFNEMRTDKPVKIVSGLSQKEREMVYMDEGHFLRNHKAKQSKSIYTLNDVEYKMVLTGTPMVNHAADIFGILHFLKPEEFPDYEDFVCEYFFVNYFRRRIRVEKKNEHVERVFYSKNSKGNHAMIANELLSRLKSLTLYPPSTTIEKKLIGRNGLPIESDDKEHLTPEEKEIMRNCLGVKFDYLLNFCSQAQGQSIIIFSTRSDTFLVPLFKALKERGLSVGLIVGATSMKERQILVEEFQGKQVDILCCNVVSAGVAEDRFLPIQKTDVKPKLVIDLVCQKTIDEKVIELLKKKQDITKLRDKLEVCGCPTHGKKAIHKEVIFPDIEEPSFAKNRDYKLPERVWYHIDPKDLAKVVGDKKKFKYFIAKHLKEMAGVFKVKRSREGEDFKGKHGMYPEQDPKLFGVDEVKMEGLRILDPIKISMGGLSMFVGKYKIGEDIGLKEKLKKLELLSKDDKTPKKDKEHIESILRDLGEIKNCNLCSEEINWDKNEGLYRIQPEISARHQSCHKKVEKKLD